VVSRAETKPQGNQWQLRYACFQVITYLFYNATSGHALHIMLAHGTAEAEAADSSDYMKQLPLHSIATPPAAAQYT